MASAGVAFNGTDMLWAAVAYIIGAKSLTGRPIAMAGGAKRGTGGECRRKRKTFG